MAASNREVLQSSGEREAVLAAPVPDNLRALAAGLPSSTNLILTRENTPNHSAGTLAGDNITSDAIAKTQLEAIDAIFDAVNNKNPETHEKKERKTIPVTPSVPQPKGPLTERIDNTSPVRMPELIIDIPATKQIGEDFNTKSTSLKVTAGYLSLSFALIGILIVLTRSALNKVLNTRPNEKTTLNLSLDFGLAGFLFLSYLLVYVLLVASSRANIHASLARDEFFKFFKKEQSDAKGKQRADVQPDEEQPVPIIRR